MAPLANAAGIRPWPLALERRVAERTQSSFSLNSVTDFMSDTLFEQLGGAKGVAAVVDDMYDRVLADPDLAHFFDQVDTQRLRQMQFEFIASALGGPVRYSGAELQAIHAGRGITTRHYAQFVGHLVDAMSARGVAEDAIQATLGRLAMYRDKITGIANVDG